jgi:hypothetical protein
MLALSSDRRYYAPNPYGQLNELVVGLESSADLSQEAAVELADKLAAALAAVSTSLGECQRATPYSPIRPIFTPEGGFKWCCNHKPEHCH